MEISVGTRDIFLVVTVYALMEILAQTFAIDPWLYAVIIAYVEDIKDIGEV